MLPADTFQQKCDVLKNMVFQGFFLLFHDVSPPLVKVYRRYRPNVSISTNGMRAGTNGRNPGGDKPQPAAGNGIYVKKAPPIGLAVSGALQCLFSIDYL